MTTNTLPPGATPVRTQGNQSSTLPSTGKSSTVVVTAKFVLIAAVFAGLVYAEYKYKALTIAVTWIVANVTITHIALAILALIVIYAVISLFSGKSSSSTSIRIPSRNDTSFTPGLARTTATGNSRGTPRVQISPETDPELIQLRANLATAEEELRVATLEFDRCVQQNEDYKVETTRLSDERLSLIQQQIYSGGRWDQNKLAATTQQSLVDANLSLMAVAERSKHRPTREIRMINMEIETRIRAINRNNNEAV